MFSVHEGTEGGGNSCADDAMSERCEGSTSELKMRDMRRGHVNSHALLKKPRSHWRGDHSARMKGLQNGCCAALKLTYIGAKVEICLLLGVLLSLQLDLLLAFIDRLMSVDLCCSSLGFLFWQY